MHRENKSLTSLKNRAAEEQGFSLIELLVAMVLFIIVSGAIYGLLQVSRIDRDRTSNRSDMLKNARMSLNLIGRDAVNAGLGYTQRGAFVPDNFLSQKFGMGNDIDTTMDLLSSVIAGNNVNQNLLNADPNVRTDLIAFAAIDRTFNSGNKKSLISSERFGSTGAKLTLETGNNRGSNTFDLYLIETSDNRVIAAMATTVTESQNFMIFNPGDPLGMNLPWTNTDTPGSSLLQNCIPSTSPPEEPPSPGSILQYCSAFPATMKRFELISYSIKPDGTLVRKIYGNRAGRPAAEQIEEQQLAYGVEDMQVKYFLENGTVADDPAAGPDGVYGNLDDTPGNMNKVRQVTITMTVRSAELDKQTGKPLKITLTSTFSTRNTEYDTVG